MNRHDTLLIACGTADDRAYIRDIFKEDYNLLEADNSNQAMFLLEQNIDCIAAVLLCTTAPEKINKRVVRSSKYRSLWKRTSVIIVAPNDSPSVLKKAFENGSLDVIPISYNPYAFQKRVHNIIELNLHKNHLEEMVEVHAASLRHTNERLVDSLSAIIEYRSTESGQHILRIRRFTQILLEEVAKNCPEYNLDERLINVIASASALHDIGKISVPDTILNKPARLTPEERCVIETHTTIGCQILESLSDIGDQEYLRYAHNICHYHHERWDGHGYPEGLAGDDIPICAQVVGLADVYDALTSKRVYKDAYSFDISTNMILNGECGAFSPKLLECFKHVSRSFEDLAKAYADGLSPKLDHFDVELPASEDSTGSKTLDTVQTKYRSLLHYMNVFVAEVDITQKHYHIIYNPYTDLSPLCGVCSFEDAKKLLLDHLVVPEESCRIHNLFDTAIPSFINAGLRKQTHIFHIRSQSYDDELAYEFTLLRPDPNEKDKQVFLMLCRRLENNSPLQSKPGESSAMNKKFIDHLFCCLNDSDLSFSGTAYYLSKITGYSEKEMQEVFGGKLINMIVPEDREAVRLSLSKQLSKGITADLEYRISHRNGKSIWVLQKLRLVTHADGSEKLYCLFFDISASKQDYDALTAKVNRYEVVLAQTENVLFEWDLSDDTISFSDTWEGIFGFKPISSHVYEALEHGSFFHPDDMPMLFDAISDLRLGASYRMIEVRIATSSGRYLWCRFRASALRDSGGNLVKIVGIIINIDAEKRGNQLLLDQSERDTLTKLFNKTTAKKLVEKYLFDTEGAEPCAMLLIDLDNFKSVNDLYGHMFGDAVLVSAAKEIKRLFRSNDIVARIGGDEFLAVICGSADRALIEERCEKLINIFKDLLHDQVSDSPLGCSIGVSLFPEHGQNYSDLFRRADAALYHAKSLGKNTYVLFSGTTVVAPLWSLPPSSVNERIDSNEQSGLSIDRVLQFSFKTLYGSDDPEEAINNLLAVVGEHTNVSRVYIFENSPDNKYCNNTFEWCNAGVNPEIDNLQGICYETDIPGYTDLYNEYGVFYCQDIDSLPKAVYDIVAPQGIRSMLHCAIRDNGVFRGYIGFDECFSSRLWTKEQIDLLSIFSDMLSVFLMKKRAQDFVVRQAADLRSILDSQNAMIYVIDPDTCEVKFINKKSHELSPDMNEGSRCYRELMGLDERCANCPAADIAEKKSAQQCIYSEKLGLDLISEASLITWEGKDACLITCRKKDG